MSAEMKRRVALWDTINEYVRTCGGDPSKRVYGNTARQTAVAAIERIVFEHPAPNSDPLDDPGYQAFLVEAAKGCRAKDRPCPGCCAGGECDGPYDHFEDDDSDNGDAECDYDEDSQ